MLFIINSYFFKKLIYYGVSLWGIGNLPAPGTCASSLAFFLTHNYYYIPTLINLLFLFLFSLVSIKYVMMNHQESNDPSWIVIDEFFAYCLGYYILSYFDFNSYDFIFFILFRFFDITKIGGISYIEKIPSLEWAIILDDLCATVYSIGLILIINYIYVFTLSF